MSDVYAWLSSYGPRIEIALETGAIVILAFVAGVSVNRMLRRSLIERYRHRRLPYETVLLLTRGATALVWLGAGTLALDLWGFSVTGLWAFLVSISTVIGVGFLATWTMISNVTANLLIAVLRPFRLGDTVEIIPENVKGQVVDRNMMFTALRERAGTTLHVPNNLFFQKLFRVTEQDAQNSFEFTGE